MERVCKYLEREIRKGKIGMIFWKVELLKKRWIFPPVDALFRVYEMFNLYGNV